MVQKNLRGLLRGGIFACFLLLSLLRADPPQSIDPFDNGSEATYLAFKAAQVGIERIYMRVLEGEPLTDDQLNLHTHSIQYLANYKFDDLALSNLISAIELREKLPELLKKSTQKEALLSSILQLIRDYYRAHELITNNEDLFGLENEQLEFKSLVEFLTKEGLLSESNFRVTEDIALAFQDAIRASTKNPQKRKLLYLPTIEGEPNEMVPFSEGKDFSGERTGVSLSLLPPDVSITLHITEFRKRIREFALGQPEYEKALVRMELMRVLGYNGDTPQKLWVMGLPGVGKDTYVNAFAMAMHPTDPLAHRNHVHSMSVAKSSAEIWNQFGSGKGYIGSETLPKLIHFLVQHSAGKYQIIKSGGHEIVAAGANPDMKYFSPHEGVLFINEFHDWEPSVANDILKQIIERGRIPVNGSGGGKDAVSEMYIPIRIVVASNDGIDLLRGRDFTNGKAPAYEKVFQRWKANYKDKDGLRAKILSRGDNVRKSGVIKGRLSDEFMSRFADLELLLLRPLDRPTLVEIAKLTIKSLRKMMKGLSRALGGVEFVFSEAGVDTIVDHHSRADDGARRINGGIDSYFHVPLLDAIADGVIEPSDNPRKYQVDFQKDKEGTISLELKDSQSNEFHSFVVAEGKPVHNIFDPDFVKRFDLFEENFNKNVFGAKALAKQIRESLFLTEHYTNSSLSKNARRFALLGLSSTGKTQTAKEIARFYFGDPGSLETIAFDTVNHEEQLKKLIYGEPNGDASPFMEAYDRNNGKMVILLDEVANIRDPIVLKALYRLLDEAIVTGFNDNKPRTMEGIIFVLTGNAGQEAFNSIPKHLPSAVQRQAQLDIYEKIQNDPHAKRLLLERHFPQALYNRIGDLNTHIMSPLDHEALRLMLHDKVGDVLARVNVSLEGIHSELSFGNEENYLKFVEAIEEHFFDVWGQGRSVDDFVVYLEQKLLGELAHVVSVESGPIELRFSGIKEIYLEDKKRGELNFELQGSSKLHTFKMMGLNSEEKVVETKAQLLQTAIHEAGHEIARRALSNDFEKAVRISIIPGLTMIDGSYVYYAGIAVSEALKGPTGTRQQFVNRLAKLYAGAEAQRLVNKGAVADIGQSNDIMRADTYAAMALLSGGLDAQWGIDAPHDGETVENYLRRLSEKRREKFEAAKDKIKLEARALATNLLRTNLNALMELGRELAKRGEMNGEEIEAFYKKYPVKDYAQVSSWSNFLSRWTNWNVWTSRFWSWFPLRGASEPKTMAAYVKDPETTAVKMPQEILLERKEAVVKKLPISSKIKFNCRTALSNI